MSSSRRIVLLVAGAVLTIAGLAILYWELEEAGWVFRRVMIVGVTLALVGGWLLWEGTTGRQID